jgi:FkbM family methyltransferase
MKKVLRNLINGNPVTGMLYKWRFERHLKGILSSHGSPCRVHPTKGRDCYGLRKGDRVIIVSLKDAVLGGMVADRFDDLFATVPVQQNGFLVVDYSRPKLHTLADGLQFEFPSLPEKLTAHEEQIARYRPKPGDLIFDCGANIGVSCYHFSKLVGPSGRVISFEPDLISVKYLRRNVARHGLDNVTIVEEAVGARDGTASFFSEGTLSSGLAHVLARKPEADVIEVPMISLSTAFERYGVPALCKIDIEGAEIELLDAAVDCISKHKINFVVDTDHWVNGEPTAKRIEAIFKRAGYQTETVGRIPVTYASRS